MTTDVQITAADVWTVAVPARGSRQHSDGAAPPWQVRHILRLHTDAGVVGLGEVGPRVPGDALRQAARTLIGADPFNLQQVRLALHSEKFYRMDLAMLGAAIQMACLDVQGRCIGRPVADLLGGSMRERVPGIAYLFRKAEAEVGPDGSDGQELVLEAARLVERYGFKTLKYKAGAVSPEEDLVAAQALREAFPEHRLRVDPNGAWSVATAINIGRRFSDLDLEWVEDPVLGIEGMSEFARRVPIPTATNMCCIQPREFPSTIAARAVNVMLLDLWYLGGPWSARQMAATCQTFGLGVGIHAGGGAAELGIGLAAEAHLAASIPGLVHAMDAMYHELTDDIIVQPWRYESGDLVVPRRPGLGVELDEDKVNKYAAVYRDVSTAEMSDVSPSRPHPAYPLF